jgi:carbamoylphosphate synthase large subunit
MPEVIETIIERERPNALLPTMGKTDISRQKFL